MADPRQKLFKVVSSRFSNLGSTPRIKVVTITAVDNTTFTATIQVGQGDVSDPVIDPFPGIPFLNSYQPDVGDLAYLMTVEGAPVIIGKAETEDWHLLSLPSGYTTVASTEPPGYRIDNQSRVWFRGACNVAANNAIGTKFTLPVGYRPGQIRALAIPYSNGTAISGHLRFDVSTAGNMDTKLISPAATVFLMFEGVSLDVRD